MKKYFILLTLILISSYITVIAQTQFGIRFSPTLTNLRVTSQIDSMAISSEGVTLGFLTGLYIDHYIGGNAFFSSGIYYAPRKYVFTVSNTLAGSLSNENHLVQYLVVPATLKLFTNELSLDTKLYFTIGTHINAKIHQEKVQNDETYIKHLKTLGMDLILGTGMERRISVNGNIYVGFTYMRGLFNALADQFPRGEGLVIKQDIYSLDLAIRF